MCQDFITALHEKKYDVFCADLKGKNLSKIKVKNRWAIILGSLGVFCGGVIWSWLYLRYRSIWPCYVSHAIVDVTMFGIGAYILFS